jgi:hypothetical protein
MKTINTFITVAPDRQAFNSHIPPLTATKPSVARLQYELLMAHPYEFCMDDLNFLVYCQRQGLDRSDMNLKARFLARPHACMRASALTKIYGFGAHYNHAGKIALYPVDAPAYHKLLKSQDLKIEAALSNKKSTSQASGLVAA